MDYRLLYDSWLWRNIFESIGLKKSDARVLELLPGVSLTIPAALESSGFRGRLYRLNDCPLPRLPKSLHFKERQIVSKLSGTLPSIHYYNVIVGNHVIDDLLFDMHCPRSSGRDDIYINPELCKAVWNDMINSGKHSRYEVRLVKLFANIVSNMKYHSVFVLRHYPSTFALCSQDMRRINIEMKVYSSITEALSACDQCATSFIDLSDINVPCGSKYPKSIFLLHKKE
jgi:hypothetical protein